MADRRTSAEREGRERSMRPIEQLDDIKVAEGDPDVRGWEVRTRERRRIGRVHSLIVDESAMTVRYLDVELDANLVGTDEPRHVLIPIGMARLNKDADDVLFDEVAIDDMLRLPAYEHGPVTREYESQLRQVIMSEGEPYDSPGYYEQPYFDRDRFYRREGSAGRSAPGTDEPPRSRG